MTIVDQHYRLQDRFEREHGRVYLTGAEALVRLPLMQRRRDQAAGRNTAGFVSGYPGSPLGGLDSLFRSQRAMLAEHSIHFQPGLNEDIAATSVWGSQHVGGIGVGSRHDGVFGLWYGKGPGVERSTDAMRTANVNGVHRLGGVLALAGDDHHARSTVTAQQSETLFIHMHMPVLNPAGIQDYLDLGLAGWAMSRFAGSWVAMICLNDTADSAASVEVNPLRPRLLVPEDQHALPPFGTIRSGGVLGGAGMEREIRELRLPAAQRFARANGLDRTVLKGSRRGPGHRGLGVVAAGRAYLDVMEGLSRLGLSPERAAALGISVYKVAMPWPLDPEGVLEFADGLEELLVVEPKHPVMEDQLGRYLRRLPHSRRPELTGKVDDVGRPLVPETGGLDALIVSKLLHRRIGNLLDDPELVAGLRPRESLTLVDADSGRSGSNLVRSAGFCSGCPHNTSTQVPDGSFAIGGTGCHGMAEGMGGPRHTRFHAQMGGEGGLWLGMAPFADDQHVFQNMGDGTYAHSGALVIRAAVAARTTMTFKILLNGYISMTGGQSIPGGLTAQQVAAQVLADGAQQVTVVTDDTAKYRAGPAFPAGVKVHDRARLLEVQDQLRTVPGVTVLIYDQACSAELRRERKKGRAAEPDKRIFINAAVCEGCGDCNTASNCISVEPLDTSLGRKRTINQSSCNKDFTCVVGYCPSFITLHGAIPRRRAATAVETAKQIEMPYPIVAGSQQPYNILVNGIGGGGVLTIGALIGMAAHLEGLAVTVLNETGLAQKNGAVQSHVRVCTDPSTQLCARIAQRATDLVIGADLVVTVDAESQSTYDRERTTAVLNATVQPTVAFAHDASLDFSGAPMVQTMRRATGGRTHVVDAIGSAQTLMGDAIYANLFLLGYAAQLGLLPVSLDALERAIELNGVAVQHNREALRLGRIAAYDASALPTDCRPDDNGVAGPTQDPVSSLLARRREFLSLYQDATYAQRFAHAVEPIIAAEREVAPGHDELGRAAVESLFRLMAYKDEYEVARLYAAPEFRERLTEEFEGDFRWSVNLAPQILNRRDPHTGRARKWAIPSAIAMPAFRVLAAARRWRGTKIDVFGMTAHRRAERARVADFEDVLAEICDRLTADNYALATRLAALPQEIRGYDTIKDQAAEQVAAKSAALLDELRASDGFKAVHKIRPS